MADTSNDGAHMSAGIDLSQFFQVFFEEAGENLDSMEQMLLELDVTKADDEELNAIFRCAHSVKGGAATFGFSDVAELTHQMEALLDLVSGRDEAGAEAHLKRWLETVDARLLADVERVLLEVASQTAPHPEGGAPQTKGAHA